MPLCPATPTARFCCPEAETEEKTLLAVCVLKKFTRVLLRVRPPTHPEAPQWWLCLGCPQMLCLLSLPSSV